MRAHAHQDDVLRRYLLGSLAPEAREGVEKQLFSEDRIFWEHLRQTEEALIDDYVWDELQGEEKEQFERHFLLSSDRRGKLEFARALRVYARARELDKLRAWQWLRNPVPVPAWAVAAAAALLLLVLPSAGWQFGTARSSRSDVSAWLSSSSGRVRSVGGDVARVLTPQRCQLVRLQLDPGSNEYDSYRATLHQVTGDEIWSQSKLAAAATDRRVGVTLTLPCELLPEGDYYVRLHGVSPGADPVLLDRYDFRVLREE